ncbi:unnamed protein product [Penicillium olsonii]|nr:unnamed protein product [Penicillium olsonii]
MPDANSKCDEKQPECGLCHKRGLECMYLPTKVQTKPSPSTTANGDSHSRDRTSPPQVSGISRLQELRLIHHFSMVTAPTIASDDTDLRFWQLELPRIATTHDYAMAGLLAAAALHLASSELEKQAFWLESALIYKTQAISGLREDLATSHGNHEVKFITSSLILLLVTAYPGIRKDELQVDPLREVLAMRSNLQGCTMVFGQIYYGPTTTSIDFWIRRESLNQGKKDQESDAGLLQLHKEILQRINEVQTVIDQCQSPSRQIYQSAYDLTLKTLHTWPRQIESVVWPIRITDSFLLLVQQGDWIARMIFLFHGLDLHLASRKWFTAGAGRRLVLGVLQADGLEIPPQWSDLASWMILAVEI